MRRDAQVTAPRRFAPSPKPPPRPVVPTEHAEQVALFQWAALMESRYPELQMLFAIPNAGAGSQKGQAGKMKAEGVKPGYPDLALDVARGPYHGLRIEMKRLRYTPSDVKPEQRKWHALLTQQNYKVEVCGGSESAQEAILNYLRLGTDILDKPHA